MDATLLPSAGIRHDGEARWAGHRGRKPTHGTKAHVATDQGSTPALNGLIRVVEVTTANVHDAAELDAVLPEAPGDVHADSAHAASRPEATIRARGGTPRVVRTGTSVWPASRARRDEPCLARQGRDGRTWGGAEALARLQAHNAEVSRARGRTRKVFGTAKRSYGLRRVRWLGLARAGPQVRLAAIAYNLCRSWRPLAIVPA